MTMAHLKITITAIVELPKNAQHAVAAAVDAMQIAQLASNSLALDKLKNVLTVEHFVADDEPAPAPKRRGRRPRAALGSSPLASPTLAQGANPVTGAPFPPTTGPNGEDLLDIPASMRK